MIRKIHIISFFGLLLLSSPSQLIGSVYYKLDNGTYETTESFESFEILNLSESQVIDYLIITPEEFVDALIPLAIWKQERGITSAICTIETILNSFDGINKADVIRNGISYFYNTYNVSWVLLGGNKAYIPVNLIKITDLQDPIFNFIASDLYYANLDSNFWRPNQNDVWNSYPEINSEDVEQANINFFQIMKPNSFTGWEPEVSIGRFPASSLTEIQKYVDQQINYESNPPLGSWMNQALFAGGYITFQEDRNNDNVSSYSNSERPEYDSNEFNNFLNKTILPPNWNSTILAETSGIHPTQFNYDLSLNRENLVQIINDGVGIANVGIHGFDAQYLIRLLFNSDLDGDDIQDIGIDTTSNRITLAYDSPLDSSNRQGLYFIESCTIGEFYHNSQSLSETLLRQSAIGVIAASGVSNANLDWDAENSDDPGGLNQGLSIRFWHQMFTENNSQPGKALDRAKIEYMNSFDGTYFKPGDNDYRALLQYNLLGDPEVPIWKSIPEPINMAIIEEGAGISVEVTSADTPIDSAAITLLNSSFYWKGITDNTGRIDLPISQEELLNLELTASKSNYLPAQLLSNLSIDNYPLMILDENTDKNLKSNNKIGLPALPLLIGMQIGIVIILARRDKKRMD